MYKVMQRSSSGPRASKAHEQWGWRSRRVKVERGKQGRSRRACCLFALVEGVLTPQPRDVRKAGNVRSDQFAGEFEGNSMQYEFLKVRCSKSCNP